MEKDEEKVGESTKRLQNLVKKRETKVITFEQNSIRRFSGRKKGFSADSYSTFDSEE